MWYRILPLSYPLQRPWPSPWWNDKTRIGLIDQISTAGEMLPAGAGLGWAGLGWGGHAELFRIIEHYWWRWWSPAPSPSPSPVSWSVLPLYPMYLCTGLRPILSEGPQKTKYLPTLFHSLYIWHLISSAFCYWKLYQLMRKEDIWEHNSYLILIGKHPAHAIY